MLQMHELAKGELFSPPGDAVCSVVSGNATVVSRGRHSVCRIGAILRLGRDGRLVALQGSVVAVFQHKALLFGGSALEVRYGKPVHTMSKLVFETNNRGPWSDLVIDGLERELAGYINRAAEQATQRTEDSLFAQIVAHMEQNIGECVTLQSLALAVRARPRAVSAEIKQATGWSFREFLRRKRLDAACRRIVFSTAPLGVIAVESGFADQAHFTREFKRVIGVPPSQYHPERSA